MSTGWPTARLGDIAKLVGGATPSKADPRFWDGDIPWASVRDLKQRYVRETEHSITPAAVRETSTNVIPAGNVVIATRVGLGKAVQVERDTAINQDLRAIIPRDPNKLLPDFIYYWYIANASKVVAAGTGATVQGVKATFISGLEIPVPPLDEQQRIVTKLDDILSCVDELKSVQSTRYANCLDMERGALEAVFGNTTVTADWEFPSLEDLEKAAVLVLGRGNVISRKDIAATPGLYPIYSSARENDGKFGQYGLWMFDEEMITWSIDGGGKLFYRPPHKFSVTNVGGTLRVIRKDLLDTKFLHFALTYLHGQHKFDWVSKAHPSVLRKVYMRVPLPSLDVQRDVVRRLLDVNQGLTKVRHLYEAAGAAADPLKSALLAQAFNGGSDGIQ